MSKGSDLAEGKQSASFSVEGSDEFLHDLKTLTRPQFMDRYEVDSEKYAELVTALRSGQKVAVMPRPIAKSDATLAQAPEPDFKVIIREPHKSDYQAEALGDNVLVIRVEREHSSQLIIPDSAKAKSDVGYVAAIGPDVERCAKGELILFDRFAAHGKEIELVDDQGIPRQHLLLNDCDVLLRLFKVKPKLEPEPPASPEP